ncbi:Hypothetical predicted protein [Olea europaea subsp. europaea]|uniref:Uncharacterized protein n=1 Tax=Olea europaea subsp. europaea TaxID=158383 RepID=A0A8S0RAN6_OLEEU|nr:Hypothetical predicted protein [Olea europaea subsp. europaea]
MEVNKEKFDKLTENKPFVVRWTKVFAQNSYNREENYTRLPFSLLKIAESHPMGFQISTVMENISEPFNRRKNFSISFRFCVVKSTL